MILFLKTKLRRIYNLLTYRHFIKDVYFASIFNEASRSIPWLRDKVFFPNGAAANYSLLYIYLRVLTIVKPERILEVGLGQSTILSNAFASHFDSALDVVESDDHWISLFTKDNEKGSKVNILESQIVNKKMNGRSYDWYDAELHQKYQVVLIDGPNCARRYARYGMLELVPKSLAEQFVIIIDDSNIYPIQQTIFALKKELEKSDIEYGESFFEGVKSQTLLHSTDLNFLNSI